MAPWASFLPMLARFWDVGPALAPYWAHVEPLLGVLCGLCWPLLGKSWDHIGLILGHFGLCWDIWAMWHHIGLMLGHFGLFSDLCVGLCFGLGHFNVVKFSSIPGVCKKHEKYQNKYNLWTALLMVFAAIFSFVFVSFLGACCS